MKTLALCALHWRLWRFNIGDSGILPSAIATLALCTEDADSLHSGTLAINYI